MSGYHRLTYGFHALSLMLAVTLCAGISAVSASYEENGAWEYIGDYDGVALYRALNESGGLLPFKAVAVLDIPYDRIVMALVDAERKPDWAPKLKATAIHARKSPNEFEYSEYYETPWPFKDREFLLAGTIEYHDDRVVFAGKNSTNIVLAREDHLKADIETLTFAVIPLSKRRTEVTFTFSGDLGGWIPSFVKTIIQKKWPVRFIQSLQHYVTGNETLETDRYRRLQKKNFVLPP